jgi:type IV secretion system protein TrbL
MIKKIKMLFAVMFSALALIVVTASPCYADETKVKSKIGVNYNTASYPIVSLTNEFKSEAESLGDTLAKKAIQLLWGLALITLCFVGIKQIFSGADFNTLFSEMVKFIMGIGFFLFILDPKYIGVGKLITFVEDFVKIIPIGDIKINGKALDSTDATHFVGSIFSIGWAILCSVATSGESTNELYTVTPEEWSLWPLYVFSLIVVIMIFVLYICISANYILTLIKAYITICCGVLAVGFGGLTWTNSWAVNYLKQLVKLGFELMAFVFVVTLMIKVQTKFLNVYVFSGHTIPFEETLLLFLMTVMTFILAHSIPSAVTSMIEGGATGSFAQSAASQGAMAKSTAKLGKNVATSGAGLAMGGAGLAMKGASKLYARLKGGKGSVDVKPNTAPSDSKE